ncbi:MAG: benzoate/H(+) symporter BenE family transporter [Anaerolineae bacterium]|nr:benzoate/H(+) symporter BenE family transporter [Anaerolineae bacterium]
MQRIFNNLRDLPAAFTPSSWLSGLLVVIVGYASSLVIVISAGQAANLNQDQLASWIWAVTVGSGILTIVMCLWFRQPVMAAWSTPGAALLVTSLIHYPFSEAIGAYLVAALAVILLGATGLFGRMMRLIPHTVVLGMLAGVLIRFGFNLFNALPDQSGISLIVVSMLLVYFLLRRVNFRAPTVGALIVGVLVAALRGDVHLESVSLALTVPHLTAPTFSAEAMLGLALPLFALAVTSQDAPGLAVLRSAGYDTNIDQALVMTGVASAVTAPLGGHGLTLAAITAAMVTNPEAHPDKDKRYAAAVAAGVFYIVFGVFGATVVSLFTALPSALIAAISGLGIFPALMGSISAAMMESEGREGALAAILCTAANFTLFGIGAPFWGLVVGVAVNLIMRWNKKSPTS